MAITVLGLNARGSLALGRSVKAGNMKFKHVCTVKMFDCEDVRPRGDIGKEKIPWSVESGSVHSTSTFAPV